jgi:hypothetical protein
MIPNAVIPYQTCALWVVLMISRSIWSLVLIHGAKSDRRSLKTCARRSHKPHSIIGSKKISRWSGLQARSPCIQGLIDDRGWKNFWTLSHCPKFQPIELVWGSGKHRSGQLHHPREGQPSHWFRWWCRAWKSHTWAPRYRRVLGPCQGRDQRVDCEG